MCMGHEKPKGGTGACVGVGWWWWGGDRPPHKLKPLEPCAFTHHTRTHAHTRTSHTHAHMQMACTVWNLCPCAFLTHGAHRPTRHCYWWTGPPVALRRGSGEWQVVGPWPLVDPSRCDQPASANARPGPFCLSLFTPGLAASYTFSRPGSWVVRLPPKPVVCVCLPDVAMNSMPPHLPFHVASQRGLWRLARRPRRPDARARGFGPQPGH